jgi:hypothetical protein
VEQKEKNLTRKENKMNSATGGEVVATKMKAGSSGLMVVPGDEYALIEANNRRAHICW